VSAIVITMTKASPAHVRTRSCSSQENLRDLAYDHGFPHTRSRCGRFRERGPNLSPISPLPAATTRTTVDPGYPPRFIIQPGNVRSLPARPSKRRGGFPEIYLPWFTACRPATGRRLRNAGHGITILPRSPYR